MNAPFASRRAVLKGGSLALLFSLGGPSARTQPAPPPGLPGDLARNRELDAWIEIAADGAVTLKTGKVELGQGVLTAFAQICADGLDVDVARLKVISGDTALSPRQGATAGSFSIPEGGTSLRLACAEARQILVQMAAEKLGAPASRLQVRDGQVSDPATRRFTSYAELVGGRRLQRQATGQAAPKPIAQRRYVGRSTPRIDLPAKVRGEAAFVHDLKPAGMVHGRVVRQPSYGARLESVDAAAVEAIPGVLKVVRDGDFLGVIAEREWTAVKAAGALAASARWREDAALPADPWAWLLAQTPQDIAVKRQARAEGSPAPGRTLEAVYRRPYQMHASIGPACAVALLQDGGLVVDTHSQTVFETAASIAGMLGLPVEKVRLRHKDGAGCYGHNGADDAAADAALLARALPGRPVRVQWSRDDEHACEPYGSAMVLKLGAGLDGEGDVLDWRHELWSTPHGTRPGGSPGNLLAGRSLATPHPQPTPVNFGAPNYAADRNAIPLYDFPGQRVTTHFVTAMPLRVSSHRGLGTYGNVFAIESFVDELAHAAGADPVEYRLRQLKDARARETIEKAAAVFGWTAWRKRPGRGRGVAFARYKNIAAYCAVCLEVEVDPRTHEIKVLRAVSAADAGEIVNPDGLANQIEGGVVQSLSWTLKEEVTHDGRRITSRDWTTYPILRFSEIPPVEVALIDRPGLPFLGAGEASQGPTPAALANAVFDAVGARVRDLPITPERIAAAARNA